MSSCCWRKLKVRRQMAVDIGCSCTPKLFTSFFSSSSSASSSHSRAKASKSSASSSCLTATIYNTSSSSSSSNSTWDPTVAATSTASPPRAPPSQLYMSSSDLPTVAAAVATRRMRKKRPPTSAAAAATSAVVGEEEGRVARESVAVVKETSEPYAAFKESMMQMIVEKEIYGWDDLNDLLNRFISLNSPCHHHLILTAFADLWNGVFSPLSPLAVATSPEGDYNYIPTAAAAASPSPYHSYYH